MGLIKAGKLSKVRRGQKHTALSVCVVPEQQSLKPASPVVFDSAGLLNKNATIRALGVAEIDLFVSNAKTDPSYIQADETKAFAMPLEPAQWKFLGRITTVEPRPYFLQDLVDSKVMQLLGYYRWLKFDLIRGQSPQIDFYSAGA